VNGEFVDDDLIALARFIRSRPVAPDGRTVRGSDWPITHTSRPCPDPGPDVCVGLRINGSEGQSAELSRRGDGWAVTAVDYWIE
jgi:hypothetical protein